ncbi:MAG: cytochrome c [Planctomycetota bacterium]|nr:MAG: cytochrome c [Planctomycetota bacterium]
MPRSARLAAALALVFVTGACTPLDNAMVAIFGRSMRDQRSFDPYENPLDPPEHSVPFAAGNLTNDPYRINTGQPERVADDMPAPFANIADPAIETLVNPVPADERSLARGEQMFNRVCAVCHGEDGVGAHAYIADKHPMLPAINLSGPVTAARSDGYIYAMIRVGRGLMPPYAHQVSHYDRWHIVNWVRELQRRAGNAPGDNGGN